MSVKSYLVCIFLILFQDFNYVKKLLIMFSDTKQIFLLYIIMKIQYNEKLNII